MKENMERKYTSSTTIEERSVELPLQKLVEQEKRISKPQQDMMAAIIGWILQGGVIVSAAVILFGILLLPFRPGGLTPQRLETFPHSLGAVWTGLTGLHPQAFITLGLLLLIATPVMRVAVSVVAFAIERDRLYVVITLIVLAILITSFVLGKGGA
jgi:uncharacterized membrane protein